MNIKHIYKISFILILLTLSACGSQDPNRGQIEDEFNKFIIDTTKGLVAVSDFKIDSRKETGQGQQTIYAEAFYVANKVELDKFKSNNESSAKQFGMRRPGYSDQYFRTAIDYDGKKEKVALIFRQESDGSWVLIDYSAIASFGT